VKFWQAMGYAARYGHQPVLTMLGPLTLERLSSFNDGIGFWIDKENASDGGMSNRFATGG
jgi:hypothetical protein